MGGERRVLYKDHGGSHYIKTMVAHEKERTKMAALRDSNQLEIVDNRAEWQGPFTWFLHCSRDFEFENMQCFEVWSFG